jgi:hypothetical protein
MIQGRPKKNQCQCLFGVLTERILRALLVASLLFLLLAFWTTTAFAQDGGGNSPVDPAGVAKETPQADSAADEYAAAAVGPESEPAAETTGEETSTGLSADSADQGEEPSYDQAVVETETEEVSEGEPAESAAGETEGQPVESTAEIEDELEAVDGDALAKELEPGELTEAATDPSGDEALIVEPVGQMVSEQLPESDGWVVDGPTDGEEKEAAEPDPAYETETVEELIISVTGAAATDSGAQTVPETEDEEIEIAPALDPYFKRQGETHYFRTNCDGYSNCAASSKPISAAIKDVEFNGLPDDGIINIEGGQFVELLIISKLSGELTLRGGADDEITYLEGSVIVHETESTLHFQNMVFNAGISVIRAGTVAFAESVINGGLSVMQSEALQIENSTLNAGMVVMNTTDVEVVDSLFAAGVVLSNVEHAAVSGSTMEGGVIVNRSQDVVFEETTFQDGISIRDSQVALNGTASDDHFDVTLEAGPSQVQVSGGEGNDSVAVTQTLAEAGEVVVGEGLLVSPDGAELALNDTVEDLSLVVEGPAEAQVVVSENVALAGSLKISADEIRVAGDVTASKSTSRNALLKQEETGQFSGNM